MQRTRGRSSEGRWVLLLALLAGLRILGFELAFPFFSNVDEYRHVDVVLKYARGYWPHPGPDHYEPETARLVGSVGSPEYARDAEQPVRAELPPPLWQLDDPDGRLRDARVSAMEAYLEPRFSLEADQPPVYYAIAGGWLALGRALGLRDAVLLYWVRGLGAVAGAALVWLAWALLRDVYPASSLVRLGVPLLLAVLPQDALYYVTSDVFSPLLGGLAFLLVLRLCRLPDPGPLLWCAAGLAGAAAVLDKYPSAAVLAACALCAVAAGSAARAASGRWLLFWTALALPLLFWLGRNQLLLGELTGTSFKVERLGWGRQSLAAFKEHPLFTPSGAWTFLSGLVPSFWRGELVWYRELLVCRGADLVYLVTSLAFVPLAALGLRRGERARAARLAEGAAALALAAGVAILAGLSLLFVFPANGNPSAEHPYFIHGRLIGAVTLPFALLYVRGIEEAAAWFPERWRRPLAWLVLGAVASVALASELWISRPVFLSSYNAFHLP